MDTPAKSQDFSRNHAPSQMLGESSFDAEGTGQLMAAPPFQLKASGSDSPPVQRKASNGGLPGDLVNGFAASSGHDLSDVNVHRNSAKPSEVGALAYAQGNDIHLGPGQEQHLPHEAAHIVQQREGRVKPTTEVAGMPVNDNQGLEGEADRMGAQAMQMKGAGAGNGLKSEKSSAPAQMKVIQRKEVETNFGKFRTDKFEKIDQKGVSIILKFDPDPEKIDAKKIGLAQSVKITKGDGSHTGIDPTKEGRRVNGGEGADFVHDRISSSNNPIYGAPDLAEGEGLEKTREDNNYTADETEVGKNATYELGHAYKENNLPVKKEAGLSDKPKGGTMQGEGNVFESTALGLEGTDKDKYFGSVKWGYKTNNGALEINDIELASKGDPTANFVEPAKLWNNTKTRGILEVVADPASAYDEATRTWVDVAKGTKGKQKKTASIGGVGVVEMVMLDDLGLPTGDVYYVKVLDLKDNGANGTVPLPIPQE